MRPSAVQPLSGVTPSVLGMTVIRGTPTPVVDTALLVTGRSQRTPTRFVCIRVPSANGKERIVALAVDEVQGVVPMPGEELAALPPLISDAQGEVVSAICRVDAELMVVLRAAQVLPEEVWEQLSAPLSRGDQT
jgi:purine-binding chemotaxis protein CheW